MNPKMRLITPMAILLGSIGIGSLAIAGLTIHRSSSNLAQTNGGMNHGGMNHDGMMKQGKMMNHNMDIGPADANYDLRFIDSMLPHHQGALVMAQSAIQKSQRPELVKFAKNIVTEQKKEIAQMQQWRKQWYPTASATPMMWHTEMNHEMPMTTAHRESMMMNMSLGEADAGFDKRFLDAMIPHHQGAVTMAKDSLKKSKRPELQQLAQNVMTSQQTEISQMTRWQRQWYANK